MLKHYMLTAWSSLAKQKVFAFVTILGLAVGLGVFLLTLSYVRSELSYDRQWRHDGNIYRLTSEQTLNDAFIRQVPQVPAYAVPIVQRDLANDIIASARLVAIFGDLKRSEDVSVPGTIYLADESVREIFDLVVLEGSLEATFSGPGNLALREDVLERYLGLGTGQSAIGKTVSLTDREGGESDYRITAVYRFPEGNTSIFLPGLSLLEESATPELAERMASRTRIQNVSYYALLSPGADLAAINGRLQDLVNLHEIHVGRPLRPGEQAGDLFRMDFQNLRDVHFAGSTGSLNRVLFFALVGLLVLVTGCVNYLILATAKAHERRREVGVRKVFGATSAGLKVQFIGESLLVAAAALVVALLFTWWAQPFFNSLLLQRPAESAFFQPFDLPYLVGLIAAVGIMGGSYPAFLLAAYQPGKVLRASSDPHIKGSMKLRGILVCFQYIIAISLIIATLAVYLQRSHLLERNWGFAADDRMAVYIPREVQNLKPPLVNAFKALPPVEAVALSGRRPNSVIGTTSTLSLSVGGRDPVDTQGMAVGHDFFSVYGMEILAGRPYDPLLDPLQASGAAAEGEDSPVRPLIVNRTASAALGFLRAGDAIGQLLEATNGNLYEVTGVVEDSYFFSLSGEVGPRFFVLSPEGTYFATLKFQSGEAGRMLSLVEETWRDIAGDESLDAIFVSEIFRQEFIREENEGRLLLSLSGLAIFLSCLGMYGMVDFALKRGIKEVGVRKALGASYGSILRLYLWRFARPVLVAAVIALPISCWGVLQWLQRFPEQIGYGVLLAIFPGAVLVTLMIAGLTVLYVTARAARAAPVISLRYE